MAKAYEISVKRRGYSGLELPEDVSWIRTLQDMAEEYVSNQMTEEEKETLRQDKGATVYWGHPRQVHRAYRARHNNLIIAIEWDMGYEVRAAFAPEVLFPED